MDDGILPQDRRQIRNPSQKTGVVPTAIDRKFHFSGKGAYAITSEWPTIRRQSLLHACDWGFWRPKSCTERKSSGIELRWEEVL